MPEVYNFILLCFLGQGLRVGRPAFDYRQQRIFLFSTTSRPALEPQLPIHWVPGTLFPAVKWLGREADRSFPYNSEVKNVQSHTSTPPYVFIAWCLVKYRLRLHGMLLSYA